MVTSLDGKVTGDFLFRPECEAATEIYYEMNREYRAQGSGGFICGRVTMEESFTGGYYPDLSKYEPVCHGPSPMNFWVDDMTGYYAIAFDPKGRLGWRSPFIEDSDPGYDRAQIIEVLTEQADPRYLAYLEELGIPYLFAGETEIDAELALGILYDHISADFLVLEGGSVINGHFLRANLVDEISLVQSPVVASAESRDLFDGGCLRDFRLLSAREKNGVLVTRYKGHGDVD